MRPLLHYAHAAAVWLLLFPVAAAWVYRFWIHLSSTSVPGLFSTRLFFFQLLMEDWFCGVLIVLFLLLCVFANTGVADFVAAEVRARQELLRRAGAAAEPLLGALLRREARDGPRIEAIWGFRAFTDAYRSASATAVAVNRVALRALYRAIEGFKVVAWFGISLVTSIFVWFSLVLAVNFVGIGVSVFAFEVILVVVGTVLFAAVVCELWKTEVLCQFCRASPPARGPTRRRPRQLVTFLHGVGRRARVIAAVGCSIAALVVAARPSGLVRHATRLSPSLPLRTLLRAQSEGSPLWTLNTSHMELVSRAVFNAGLCPSDDYFGLRRATHDPKLPATEAGAESTEGLPVGAATSELMTSTFSDPRQAFSDVTVTLFDRAEAYSAGCNSMTSSMFCLTELLSLSTRMLIVPGFSSARACAEVIRPLLQDLNLYPELVPATDIHRAFVFELLFAIVFSFGAVVVVTALPPLTRVPPMLPDPVQLDHGVDVGMMRPPAPAQQRQRARRRHRPVGTRDYGQSAVVHRTPEAPAIAGSAATLDEPRAATAPLSPVAVDRNNRFAVLLDDDASPELLPDGPVVTPLAPSRAVDPPALAVLEPESAVGEWRQVQKRRRHKGGAAVGEPEDTDFATAASASMPALQPADRVAGASPELPGDFQQDAVPQSALEHSRASLPSSLPRQEHLYPPLLSALSEGPMQQAQPAPPQQQQQPEPVQLPQPEAVIQPPGAVPPPQQPAAARRRIEARRHLLQAALGVDGGVGGAAGVNNAGAGGLMDDVLAAAAAELDGQDPMPIEELLGLRGNAGTVWLHFCVGLILIFLGIGVFVVRAFFG
jgi:hypothetical protein